MDDPTTSSTDYAQCLRDLAAVNRVTMTHRPTLRWLSHVTREVKRGGSLSILDVACGEGDLLREIRRWADRRGLHATLVGIDLNPRSAVTAGAATPPDMAISYVTANVFDYKPDPAPDYIVSSQFAHHLTDADVVRFLMWLELNAGRGWFIADLHRHSLAYYGFPVLARIAGWHRIVRLDGMVSIARSFRAADWRRYLAEANLAAEVRWRLAFRYCVGRVK